MSHLLCFTCNSKVTSVWWRLQCSQDGCYSSVLFTQATHTLTPNREMAAVIVSKWNQTVWTVESSRSCLKRATFDKLVTGFSPFLSVLQFVWSQRCGHWQQDWTSNGESSTLCNMSTNFCIFHAIERNQRWKRRFKPRCMWLYTCHFVCLYYFCFVLFMVAVCETVLIY